jgi:uncharacterized protein (TIGR02147 family)
MQVAGVNDVASILKSELLRRTKSDPKYSLRTFAKSLGVSPATLSGVLTGKRAFSTKKAGNVAEKLELSPNERASFVETANSRKAGPAPITDLPPDTKQLKLDEYYVISDWYHYAIREMASLHRKKLDAKTISRELGCSYVEAEDALTRLKRLGFLQEKNGRIVKADKHVTSGTDFPSSAMKRVHMQMLQKAKQSLLIDPISERDFTNITMAIDSSRLAEAKKRIKKFRWELCEFLEGGNPDRVFSLHIGLFPLTRQARK